MSKNYSLVISQGCTLRYFGVGVPPGSQYAGPIRQKHFCFQKCYLVGEPMTLTKYPVIFEPEHCVRQKYLIHSCRSFFLKKKKRFKNPTLRGRYIPILLKCVEYPLGFYCAITNMRMCDLEI